MSILIVSQTYNLTTNGQGVFVVHLAEGLAKAGQAVTVLQPSERGQAFQERLNGVDVRGIRSISLAPFYPEVRVTPWPGASIGRLMDETRPDIVHIHDHYPLCASVLKEALRRGLPVIGTNNFLPDNMAMNAPVLSHFRAFLDRILWKTVLNVFNRVDFTTAATETAADILRRQGIQTPVRAISCGVDLDRYRPMEGINWTGLRRRYGLDPERTLFLYVGRLDREKGLDLLLKAFGRLKRDDLQLAITGRGRYSRALREQARELDLGERVVFTGFVPGEDLPGLMNSAEVFVMPSETELQSLATLEAMATGRPVVAANARALPELVRDGANGYLFKAGDVERAARAIRRIADQPEEWARMGEASQSIASKHGLDEMVRRYLSLYRVVNPAMRVKRTQPVYLKGKAAQR